MEKKILIRPRPKPDGSVYDADADDRGKNLKIMQNVIFAWLSEHSWVFDNFKNLFRF